jgi:hypothetical protein
MFFTNDMRMLELNISSPAFGAALHSLTCPPPDIHVAIACAAAVQSAHLHQSATHDKNKATID